MKDCEQLNREKVSKYAILLLDSASLGAFDKETQKLLSSVNYVMTDSGFSFSDYMAKLERLVEADKE